MLSKGRGLAQYNWNEGQDFNGKLWHESDFPSDSVLIMALFSNFMESHIPNFKEKFICNHSSKGKPKSIFRILQSSSKPPHYNILYKEKIYDVKRGRDNVFSAISLWVNEIMKNGGYVQNFNIGGRGMIYIFH